MRKEDVSKREERKQRAKSRHSPESRAPPSEDLPEKDVSPEIEGDVLDTEGEVWFVMNSENHYTDSLLLR